MTTETKAKRKDYRFDSTTIRLKKRTVESLRSLAGPVGFSEYLDLVTTKLCAGSTPEAVSTQIPKRGLSLTALMLEMEILTKRVQELEGLVDRVANLFNKVEGDVSDINLDRIRNNYFQIGTRVALNDLFRGDSKAADAYLKQTFEDMDNLETEDDPIIQYEVLRGKISKLNENVPASEAEAKAIADKTEALIDQFYTKYPVGAEKVARQKLMEDVREWVKKNNPENTT